MKESHVEGLATHDAPKSCGASRKDSAEALIGARASRVFSCERDSLRDADAMEVGGRQIGCVDIRETQTSPARSGNRSVIS